MPLALAPEATAHARGPASAPVIETFGLTKRYGAARGIEDVSLAVNAGEVFGFLGPNGAGKTTTIRTLLDLLHPSSGEARIFGLDSRRDSVAIRARSGNLPGDFYYDPHLTGRELIRYLMRLRGIGEPRRVASLERRFRAQLDRPLRELSRGNRQKVGLIQAVCHSPELLILDEPTGGLDPLMQEEFLELVEEERARGCTVFLSSHELDEVQRVCDRVGVIKAGRLIAVERVVDLMAKSYRQVELRFAEPVDMLEFSRLPGVRDLVASNGTISFRVEGEIDEIVKTAARHRVRDLDITHPSLEEIFVSYYGDGTP